MPYRTIKYHAEGMDLLNSLLKRLKEIAERKEIIMHYELECYE